MKKRWVILLSCILALVYLAAVSIRVSETNSRYLVLNNWDRWMSCDEESDQCVMIAENGPEVAVLIADYKLGVRISIWDDNDDGLVDREILNGTTFFRDSSHTWREVSAQFHGLIIKYRRPEFKVDKNRPQNNEIVRELLI